MSKHFLDWIERRGQELRCRLSLEPTAALNPYKLAQTMEVRVVSPLDILELAPCLLDQLLVQDSDSWSGGTLPLPNGKTIVVLNPNHSETRKRATLMEELAHVFLGHTPSSLMVESMAGITQRTSLLDPDVKVSLHPAPDILKG
ncbi:ImmA/IrrE family metallo-endopeptidase [Microcoleus sp. B5-C4]|uniref:ImmA/IrrE family metallo-endopeptidase n=1 Tax=Microcoleus sp. B5-C4 TaxID=2818675 RepID=UPI002FD27F2F